MTFSHPGNEYSLVHFRHWSDVLSAFARKKCLPKHAAGMCNIHFHTINTDVSSDLFTKLDFALLHSHPAVRVALLLLYTLGRLFFLHSSFPHVPPSASARQRKASNFSQHPRTTMSTTSVTENKFREKNKINQNAHKLCIFSSSSKSSSSSSSRKELCSSEKRRRQQVSRLGSFSLFGQTRLKGMLMVRKGKDEILWTDGRTKFGKTLQSGGGRTNERTGNSIGFKRFVRSAANLLDRCCWLGSMRWSVTGSRLMECGELGGKDWKWSASGAWAAFGKVWRGFIEVVCLEKGCWWIFFIRIWSWIRGKLG